MLKAVQKVRERHALKGDANQPLGNLVEEIARMVEGHPYQEGLRGWLLEPNSLASSYNRAEGSDVAVHSLALAAAIRRKFLQAAGGPAPSSIFLSNDPSPSQHRAASLWRYRPNDKAMWNYAEGGRPAIEGWIVEPIYTQPQTIGPPIAWFRRGKHKWFIRYSAPTMGSEDGWFPVFRSPSPETNLRGDELLTTIKEFARWHHLNELTISRGGKPSDSEIDFEAIAWNRITRALTTEGQTNG